MKNAINLDEPFNQMIYEKIFPSVADTLCQLTAKISLCRMDENKADETLQKKANLLKCAVAQYIDLQAEVLKTSLRTNEIIQNRCGNLADNSKGCATNL